MLHPEHLPLQQSTADPYRSHSNTQRQVWLSLYGVSWCTQGFVPALQESVSPVLCKFCWLYGEVNGDLLQEGLCHTQVCCTQSPCPCDRPLLTYPPQGILKHSKAGLAQSLWGLLVCTRLCLSPPSVSGRYEV